MLWRFDWYTYLFFSNPHFICHTGKYSWFNEVTFCPPFVTTASNRCPFFLSRFDQVENFIILLFTDLIGRIQSINHRSNHKLSLNMDFHLWSLFHPFIEWISYFACSGHGCGFFDKFIINLLMNKRARSFNKITRYR